jgi:uncharacterized protein YqeY
MSLKDRLKADLLDARKAKNEAARNVLSVVLGDIQTEESTHQALSDEQIEAKLRKLAENNQQVLDANPSAANSELLRAEIAVLNTYLPKYMTAGEIKEFIIARPELAEAVDATKEGQAIGLILKALKQADLKALGTDVKAAVGLMRT